MAITFHCPHCNLALRVADSAAGKHGNCKGCGQRLQAPAVSTKTAMESNKQLSPQPTGPPALPIPDHAKPVEQPNVRQDRLFALTGGADMSRQFTLEKVVWHKGQVCHFADLIFTEVGILIAPCGAFETPDDLTGLFTLVGGLQGGLFGIMQSNRKAKQLSLSTAYYDAHAPAQQSLRPGTVFESIPEAEFLPADEIQSLRCQDPNELWLQFRGVHYRFLISDNAKLEMLPKIETWLPVAADRRRAADAANPSEFPTLGAVALFEWSQRPEGHPPLWVSATISAITSSTSRILIPAELQVLTTAKLSALRRLTNRLSALGVERPNFIVQPIRMLRLTRCRRTMTIAAAIAVASFTYCAALVYFKQPGFDVWAALTIPIGLMFLPVGIITTFCGFVSYLVTRHYLK